VTCPWELPEEADDDWEFVLCRLAGEIVLLFGFGRLQICKLYEGDSGTACDRGKNNFEPASRYEIAAVLK